MSKLKQTYWLWLVLFLRTTSISIMAQSELTITGSFVPPIGIPMPPFGINEAASDLPSPWTSNVTGFYYVKSGGANSGNGYPANPRSVIPSGLPAGAVVVVEGQYTKVHDARLMLNGTSQNPIFIISSGASQAILKRKFNVGGSFFIIDGINAEWDNSSYNGKMGINGSYVVVKNGDFRGDTNKGVGSCNISNGDHVLFYNNNVHIAGNWQATEDQDTHAMQIGTNISYCWVIDNSFSRSSGDGIQINAGNAANQPNTHHIYIGRNEAYENKQCGFWTKQANDVIFSGNIVHDHKPSGSSPGVGLGGQYGPERVWFLYNKIYDNYGGIALASRSGGIGKYSYYIGNEIYDNNLNPSFDPDNSWAYAAIMISGGENVTILNNAMANNSGGINSPVGNAEFLIYNNIIDEPTVKGAKSIFLYESSTASASSMDYNIFNAKAAIRWGRGAMDDLGSFQSYFGKGLNCEETDPNYTDPVNGDFTLDSTSLAIDAGYASAVYDTFYNRYGISIKVDANGVSRPQNGTWDIGAYEYTASQTSALQTKEDVAALPTSFSLSAFPNPFNPSTTIKYELQNSSNVILKIYNLAGQEIEILINRNQTVGEHEITWKPEGLPSGMYFYRLQVYAPERAGECTETMKLILQK